MGKMEDVRIEQGEKETKKKGHSNGSKKCKKSVELQEEDDFPTSLENLYNAKATTLSALIDMVELQGIDIENGDGSEVGGKDGSEEK